MSRNFLVVKNMYYYNSIKKVTSFKNIYMVTTSTMSKIESNSTVYNGKLVLFLQNKKHLCITNDAKEINCILIKKYFNKIKLFSIPIKIVFN